MKALIRMQTKMQRKNFLWLLFVLYKIVFEFYKLQNCEKLYADVDRNALIRKLEQDW